MAIEGEIYPTLSQQDFNVFLLALLSHIEDLLSAMSIEDSLSFSHW